MTAKIIVAIILAVLSFICLILALNENTVNGKTNKIRSFYGIMISMSSIAFTVAIMWLLFF